jgi:Tol biopolymer transport system component
VWSFGVVLFEMLSGRQLFAGETASEIMAAVIKEEPDWSRLPASCPPAVVRLLRRCLRKKPRERLHDIADARLEIEEARSGTTVGVESESAEVEATLRRERSRRRRERFALVAGLLTTTAVAAGLVLLHPWNKGASAAPVRLASALPAGWRFADFGWPVPSPDGRQVVFLARPDDAPNDTGNKLWIRSLDSLALRPLAGTEGASEIPAWSPDGRFIAFFAGGELRKLSVADGVVQRICAVPEYGNGGTDWGANGTILFSAGANSARIYHVQATGGVARPLTTLHASRGEKSHHLPQFLPDGRHFLLTVNAGEQESGLFVASLDAPDARRRVAPGWLHYAYASGHLLYARGGTLFAQRFDPERAEAQGDPVAVVSSLASWSQIVGLYGASPSTIAVISGQGADGQVQLAWIGRKGDRLRTVGNPGNYGQIALSPDERSVAIEVLESGSSDLWLMDLARGVASRLTATPIPDVDPVWSPDGRSLAFAAFAAEKTELKIRKLSSGDAGTLQLDSPGLDFPESWSGDGRTLFFCRLKDGRNSAWALDTASKRAVAVVSGPFHIDEPQISPDGRWLAYSSTESGKDEVYVVPFGRDGERVRVSVDGGGQPKWRADGNELFFVSGKGVLQAATLRRSGERLELTLPVDLFALPVSQGAFRDDYAPSADGQRFLVKTPVRHAEKPQLEIVTNWTSLVENTAR